MDSASVGSSAAQKSHNLFQVYLRLRPPQPGAANADRFLSVEPPAIDAPSTSPTHVTLNPPNDRRRAIEKFAFTQVFEEDATQLDVFHCTNVVPLVEGVLAPHGGDGTDALLATLGVTGSGKSHTILGSKSQRGLTQLALDVMFRSFGVNIVDCDVNPTLEASIRASDASDANIFTAVAFIDTVYAADTTCSTRPSSRAPTPMIVGSLLTPSRSSHSAVSCPHLPELSDGTHLPTFSPKTVRMVRREDYTASSPSSPSRHVSQEQHPSCHGNAQFKTPKRKPLQALAGNIFIQSPSKHYMGVTASTRQKKAHADTHIQKGEQQQVVPPTPRRLLNRPSVLPQVPDVSTVNVSSDPAAEYSVLISMYEVYNDRIFDLLTPPIKSAATKEYRRRPLLFKPTELSQDRKVVAGLRKIICSNLDQALMVLEAGLHERRVAGTGSNSVSSRSHGFFSIEVKKRAKSSSKRHEYPWGGSTLTVVDLAGSERARDAKTAGATLAEAGKINESLMYLGQCLQMQSDSGSNSKTSVVPFRQCKLTELLFSNSFPSSSSLSQSQAIRRNPQKAVMIVAADPHGDFNATSQILRYSALAREVTVPRVPSITQTILQANAHAHAAHNSPCSSYDSHPQPCSSPILSPSLHQRPFFPPSTSPHLQRTFSPVSTTSEDRATMEMAALEIARLSEEVDYYRESSAREHEARVSAEAHLLSMEDRMLELEQAVREDCANEFEQRLAVEMARWKAGMQVELERGEEHWDRKIEVFERSLGVQIHVTGASSDEASDAGENKENVLVEDLEQENDRLRREIMVLKRELAGRSPSKRVPLGERDDLNTTGSPRSSRHPSRNMEGNESLHRKMEKLRVSSQDNSKNMGTNMGSGGQPVSRSASKNRVDDNGSPQKKVRKFMAKKWDSGLDDDDLF